MPASTPSGNPCEDDVPLRKKELALREEELSIRQKELSKSRLWNPLTIGVIAAVIGLIGNAVVTFLQGQQNIDLKEREFKNNVDIETRKFKSSLFIEAIRTGNPESASKNLRFLLDLGFIEDPKGTIEAHLSDPSKIPVLPSNASQLPNPIDERWRCVFKLCFGRALREIDSNLTWQKLALAVELAPFDIRYYRWLSSEYIPPQLENELCASSKDEILAFFEDEKLTRVSLRFYNTNECPNRFNWLKYFARGAETTVSDRLGGKFFNGRGNNIYLIGWSGPKVTVVDVALRSSGYVSSDDWITFLKEYLDGDGIKS